MNNRLILCAGIALSLLTGCAHKTEHSWYKGGAGRTELDRDLKLAHAEAMKAYPSVDKLTKKPADPAKAEMELKRMQHSVEALYMEAHGWYLVYYDWRGRIHQAHLGAH